jgi:hypothetical protein
MEGAANNEAFIALAAGLEDAERIAVGRGVSEPPVTRIAIAGGPGRETV